MNHDLDRQESMLSRLKLTAIRDQLDNLLDQTARRELNLREALAFLCEAAADNRRIGLPAVGSQRRPLVLPTGVAALRTGQPAADQQP